MAPRRIRDFTRCVSHCLPIIQTKHPILLLLPSSVCQAFPYLIPILTPAMTTASPSTKLPQGAWDTHVHVFDSSIGPFTANRAYTPAEAPLSDLLKFSSSLTEDHSSTNLVIVQPSPYGSDNKVLLEVLQRLHRQGHTNSRGIAVIDVEKTSDQDLQDLHEAGVRGVRLNEGAGGKTSSPQEFIQNLHATADRIKHLPGWKIQLHISGCFWDGKIKTT